MKKHVISILILIALFLFGACENKTEPAEKATAENNAVSLTPLPCEDLGNAAYLIDGDFVLNEENMESCLEDFFAAPCPLDFYLEDEDGKIYRCDDPALGIKFANALTQGDYTVISMRKYNAAVAHGSIDSTYPEAGYERAYFANALGQVSIIIGKDGTYLDFYRAAEKENEMNESGRTFFSTTDLFDGLLTVKEEILPYCEVIE